MMLFLFGSAVIFFFIVLPPPTSTLFPYTTLFRSPDAALVLGLDLGARFLRGAICDLQGVVRARQDVELRGARGAEALDVFTGLRDALIDATGLPAELVHSAVVGVPGAIPPDGRVRPAAERSEGRR